MKINLTFFLLFLTINNYGAIQELPKESLTKKTYDYFHSYFSRIIVDTVDYRNHANAYLDKAKSSNDSIKIANAYFYLSESYSPKDAIIFCDSILLVTRDILTNHEYPALGYLQKGNLSYKIGNNEEAIKLFLKAYEEAKKRNNISQVLVSQVNIGILKLEIGEKEEALKLSRNYLNYLESTNILYKNTYLLDAYLALSNAYIHNKKHDSASIYIKKGIAKALLAKDTAKYSNYLIRSGINLYYKKEYYNSIDSLKKGNYLTFDKHLEAISNLYIGKSYFNIDQIQKGLPFLKSVDSFLQKPQNLNPELIQIYDLLIKYYKDIDNKEKLIYYLDQLIKKDSILKINDKFLQKKISEGYDIPMLISQKDKMLKNLKRKNTQVKNHRYYLLFIFIIVLLLLVFFFRRKNYIKKRRFERIIEDYKYKLNQANSIDLNAKKSNSNSSLPKELVDKILSNLDEFEKGNKFILKNYTLNILAKEFKTNSAYLSKIINENKELNFSSYLNNLKINYAIKLLKENKTLRSYTIQAIAKEVGFNTAQSFSVAFNKQTGIYPSFFIKKLEKEDKIRKNDF